MAEIKYQIENKVSIVEFKSVLVNSTLDEKRPVDNEETLFKVNERGNLIGIARSLTAFNYCTYLSDLAVDENYQKMGIGKERIGQTKLASSKDNSKRESIIEEI